MFDPATSQQAMRQMSAGGADGAKFAEALDRVPRELVLDRDGLGVVLELRVCFGMTPSQGSDLASYVDTSYAEEAIRTTH